MSIIDQIILWLENLSRSINLELFVVIGSFLEEIIAPIPSPFVMTTAAALAQAQDYVLLQLAVLVVVASLAKTVSSYLIYFAADKLEDVVVNRFGKYVGLSHKLIEQIGSFLTGTWIDDLLMILARALPFVPTILVSAGAGVIKYNKKSFIITTFLGIIIRNAFYLWVGYIGATQAEQLWLQIKDHPVFIVLAMMTVILIIYALIKTKDAMFEKMMSLKKAPTKET
jgi:membrane protein DedA with SNARE-associated domain